MCMRVCAGVSARGRWLIVHRSRAMCVGIEPVANDILIQPILAYGDGANQWTIFNGYYDWHTGGWWQSTDYVVQPGQTIQVRLMTWHLCVCANVCVCGGCGGLTRVWCH